MKHRQSWLDRYRGNFLSIVVATTAVGAVGASQPFVTAPQAQQTPLTPLPSATPDVTRLGPQVGQTVPGFRLSDQTGQPRTLRSLMGAKGLMLVFSRSSDW